MGAERLKSSAAWLTAALFVVILGVVLAFLIGNTAYAAQESTRIAGETAEETSAAISKAAYPNGCNHVIIARSDDFADAMSATGLAGTLDCPIVTTSSDAPSKAMLDEVKRLGADEIYIVGGKAAVSMSVEEALAASGVSVDRVSGENSWDTSVECAKRIAAKGGNSRGDVIVATSQNFQDALSISSFAFKYGVPIILGTDSYGLTDEAKAIVSDAGGMVYVPGGRMAVPSSSAEDIVGESRVVRMAGETGYDTSNQVATYLVDHGLLKADSVFVATGALAAKGVDALSGAVLAGKSGAPILLVSGNSAIESVDSTIVSGTDSEGTPAFLEAHKGSIGKATVFGGNAVVPDSFKSEVDTVVVGTGGTTSGGSSSGGSGTSDTSSSTVAPASDFEYAVGKSLVVQYDYSLNPFSETIRVEEEPHSVNRDEVSSWWDCGGYFEYSVYKDPDWVETRGWNCGEGIYITKYKGESKNVVVPGSIDGKPVVCVALTDAAKGGPRYESFDFGNCESLKAICADARAMSFGDLNEVTYLDGWVGLCPSDLSQLTQLECLIGVNLSSDSIIPTANLRYFEGTSVKVNENRFANASKLETLNLLGESHYNLVPGHGLSSINLEGCSALKSLNITDALMTDLNIEGLQSLKLENLDVSYCSGLTSVTVSDLPSLNRLALSNNSSLKTLNVFNLHLLNVLGARDNALESLRLSDLPELSLLDVPNNKLKGLSIDGLDSLETLFCDHNCINSEDYKKLEEWLNKVNSYGQKLHSGDISHQDNA